MSESVPNRFNPMGVDITNGGSQIVQPTEGVVIYESNTCAGTIISSTISMNGGTIGNGNSGSGMIIYNSGYTNAVYVVNGGIMHVSSGGFSENTFVSNGGSMIVSNGGSADYPAIYSGGTIIVKNGGIATNMWAHGNAITICEPGGTLEYEE